MIPSNLERPIMAMNVGGFIPSRHGISWRRTMNAKSAKWKPVKGSAWKVVILVAATVARLSGIV
jgi:hypothetical protein